MKGMKIIATLLSFFFTFSVFAKSLDERTSLCFILATTYDEIVYNTHGDIDSLFFLAREPKKASQAALREVIAGDAGIITSVQWKLSRLAAGTPYFKGLNVPPLLKKHFQKTLGTQEAQAQKEAFLKGKLTFKKAEEFREFRVTFTKIFESEYGELCTKDELVGTAI
jgi:hypothetical protein